MAPALAAVGQSENAVRVILIALTYFMEKGLNQAVNVTVNRLRSLRSQLGAEAFDAAWRACTDDSPLPDWLVG